MVSVECFVVNLTALALTILKIIVDVILMLGSQVKVIANVKLMAVVKLVNALILMIRSHQEVTADVKLTL
jgi:hypothetical protein